MYVVFNLGYLELSKNGCCSADKGIVVEFLSFSSLPVTSAVRSYYWPLAWSSPPPC